MQGGFKIQQCSTVLMNFIIKKPTDNLGAPFFFFNPLLQQNLMMTDDSHELFVVGKYDHNLEPIACRPLSYVERTSILMH